MSASGREATREETDAVVESAGSSSEAPGKDGEAGPTAPPGPPTACAPKRRGRRGPSRPVTAAEARVTSRLFATASDGLRFELVRNEDPQSFSGPFAVLSDAGRYSRVLLGRIVSAGGSVVREVALKVQKDSYREGGTGLRTASLLPRISNEDIANLWHREYRHLAALAGEGSGAAELLDLFGPAEGGEAPAFPPTLYCSERDLYLHPACPGCGQAMSDCRDGKLLQDVNAAIDAAGARGRVGLYRESVERYLYCPACAPQLVDSGRAPALYLRALPAGQDATDFAGRVADRRELWRQWGHAAKAGALAEADMPCGRCPLVDACLVAEGDEAMAPRVLHVLSFHEFFALPLDRLDLHYDQAVQLLGGRSLEDLRRGTETLRRTSAQVGLMERLARSLGSSPRLIYEQEETGLRELEILRLKLDLFARLCRATARVHATCGPHLDLKPENVMVRVGGGEGGAPALWNLDVRVIDLASSRPYFVDGEEGKDEIFVPPFNFNDTYTSPVVSDDKSFGYKRQARLKILEVTPSMEREGEALIVAELESNELKADEYTSRDAIVLALECVAPCLEGLELRLRKRESRAINRLLLESTPLRLTPDQQSALEQMVAGAATIPYLDFWTYKCFHVPCDLFSLGVLLFQTLLETEVHEIEGETRRGQSVAEIREAALTFASDLAIWARREVPPDVADRGRLVGDECLARLRGLETEWRSLSASERGERRPPWCARENLVHSLAEPGCIERVDLGLFEQALLVGVRLVTNIPGFSYCQDNADFSTQAAEEKAEAVAEDVESLVRRVHAGLFGAGAAHRAIHEVLESLCGQVDADLGDAARPTLHDRRDADLVAARLDRLRLEEGGALRGADLARRTREVVREAFESRQAVEEIARLAAALRDRFPYAGDELRAENGALRRELERLQQAVTRTLAPVLGEGLPGERLVGEATLLLEVTHDLLELADRVPATASDWLATATGTSEHEAGEIRRQLALVDASDPDLQDVQKLLRAKAVLPARLRRLVRKAAVAGGLDLLATVESEAAARGSWFDRLLARLGLSSGALRRTLAHWRSTERRAAVEKLFRNQLTAHASARLAPEEE